MSDFKSIFIDDGESCPFSNDGYFCNIIESGNDRDNRNDFCGGLFQPHKKKKYPHYKFNKECPLLDEDIKVIYCEE